MKILFVEDDQHTCELMAAILEAHRYAVDVVTDGEAGLEMAQQWPYDLILLDIMLPKLNGIEVCRQLRAETCQTPILMLTSRGASEDVVAGLDAGADDYVVKACEPEQLMARVRALLRRRGEVSAAPVLTWGRLCLDPASAQVTFGSTVVPCRPKEYALLELFLRQPGRLLSRSSIIDHLWSFDDAPVEGSVTTLVKDLRRRLKAAGMAQDPIETVYGLGYRLKPDAPSATTVPSALATESAAGAPAIPVAGSPEHRLQTVLQRVDVNFRASWPERLAVLGATEQALRTGDCTRQQREAALASIHKLVGGLGTFGYDAAAEVAEALEAALREHLVQETRWTQQFTTLLAELRQALPPPEAVATTAAQTTTSGAHQ